MKALSFSEASKLLRYDAATGKLYWLPRPVEMFKSEGSSRRWHSNFCGKEALTATNSEGYRVGTIFEQMHRAHRVAWLLTHGRWPDGQIDHLNGDRADNRLENLRDVPKSLNQRNSKMQSNNTSGVTGVRWAARHKKWQAEIKVNNQTEFLGLFDTIEAAAAARAAANARHGFTERHGL